MKALTVLGSVFLFLIPKQREVATCFAIQKNDYEVIQQLTKEIKEEINQMKLEIKAEIGQMVEENVQNMNRRNKRSDETPEKVKVGEVRVRRNGDDSTEDDPAIDRKKIMKKLKKDSEERAVCKFDGSAKGAIEGTLELFEKDEELYIMGNLQGFSGKKHGKHGFHVHEKGSIGDDCKDAKGHFNPTPGAQKHGAPRDATRHMGDLGNIENEGARVVVHIRDKIALLKGRKSIIGKTLVIHADEDDLGKGKNVTESKKTGSAGDRIGCCIIKEKDD